MSILDRLNLLVRSNINTRGDGMRNAMQDVQSSLRDARRQLAELRVGERKLLEQLRQERERADQWEDRAVLALRRGEEDLAREALIVKNDIMREAERLRGQLEDHRAYMRDISSALEALEMKLEGTRTRMDSQRRERSGPLRNERDWDAEMKRRLREQDSGPSSSSRPSSHSPRRERSYDGDAFDSNLDSSFREFDRMSHKISRFEADIEATRELSDDDLIDPRRSELEDIFDKMEDRKRTDDGLSALKKKFED